MDFDGENNRPKSDVMITSPDQTITGKKIFRNIEVPEPTSNNQASNKKYIDENFMHKMVEYFPVLLV